MASFVNAKVIYFFKFLQPPFCLLQMLPNHFVGRPNSQFYKPSCKILDWKMVWKVVSKYMKQKYLIFCRNFFQNKDDRRVLQNGIVCKRKSYIFFKFYSRHLFVTNATKTILLADRIRNFINLAKFRETSPINLTCSLFTRSGSIRLQACALERHVPLSPFHVRNLKNGGARATSI